MKTALPFLLLASLPAFGESLPSPTDYRQLDLKIRDTGSFKIPAPAQDAPIAYRFRFGAPKFPLPSVDDLSVPSDERTLFRVFYDKMFLADGSMLQIGDKEVPLTCIFVDGQDNRFATGGDPLLPAVLMKVYLVANDYTCTGPINPGWPGQGSRPETWDTYLYYEIRDTTVMLPTEVKLRYRWNEYEAVLVNR